jgi:uncharacterized protein
VEPSRDRNGLIVLGRRACLERLALRRVGTIALTDAALPIAVPAVYAVADREIVLRADRTSLLGRNLPGAVVSLCVFDIPDDLASGWTVTVTGHAAAVDDEAQLDRLPLDRLPMWGASGDSSVVACLDTERISGRVLPPDWGQRSDGDVTSGPFGGGRGTRGGPAR